MNIEGYKPFNDKEINDFLSDVYGYWEPSANDQLRLLSTVVELRAKLDKIKEALDN